MTFWWNPVLGKCLELTIDLMMTIDLLIVREFVSNIDKK